MRGHVCTPLGPHSDSRVADRSSVPDVRAQSHTGLWVSAHGSTLVGGVQQSRGWVRERKRVANEEDINTNFENWQSASSKNILSWHVVQGA